VGCPEILTIQKQQVKRDEDALTPAKKQITKLRPGRSMACVEYSGDRGVH
jgi:hypothetical protein